MRSCYRRGKDGEPPKARTITQPGTVAAQAPGVPPQAFPAEDLTAFQLRDLGALRDEQSRPHKPLRPDSGLLAALLAALAQLVQGERRTGDHV
jgi:hypothetical protein